MARGTPRDNTYRILKIETAAGRTFLIEKFFAPSWTSVVSFANLEEAITRVRTLIRIRDFGARPIPPETVWEEPE